MYRMLKLGRTSICLLFHKISALSTQLLGQVVIEASYCWWIGDDTIVQSNQLERVKCYG